MKLHNTLTRKIEEIKPIKEGEISLYTCGLTVYSQPHIGNWVPYIYWDVLQRTLQTEGYKIKRVQNITDVGHLTSDEDAGEDKMLKSALSEGTTAWDVANKYIAVANHEAYELLGLIKPKYLPRATDYIAQQIEFVKQLEAKGFTYKIADGVYFDTSKLNDYGKLAQLDIKGLRFGARVADTGKKNPTDFAVWKFSPSDEKRDMEWDSPWGKGFPGWHLECSAIVREILGDQIDIHTGGIDHIPVHHTNEIAQTEALTGKTLANTWVHANHIKVNGTKMSKSLGNVYTLKDITDKGFSIDAFKLMILSKHYQTEGNFTWENLEAAQNRLKRWQNIAELRWQEDKAISSGTGNPDTQDAFAEHIHNDINTPAAIEALEKYLGHMEDLHFCSPCMDNAYGLLETYFGLDIFASTPDISKELYDKIRGREAARSSKDWVKSDQLRDELKDQGISLRDTDNGAVWYRI
ncbi:MAG: cysteine--tRNA ligase [Patescibacteria group bacterium]